MMKNLDHFYNAMTNSIINQANHEKALARRLGFEPMAAGGEEWKVQTDPLCCGSLQSTARVCIS